MELPYKNRINNNFLIEDLIVVELKSVTKLSDIHRAQLLNYINLMKKPKGILVNFNVKNFYLSNLNRAVSYN